MPKIFEYLGFLFYFYSNEHEPIHVHVTHGEKESIFELIVNDGILTDIRQRAPKGVTLLSGSESEIAKSFIRRYFTNIIEKWIKFFVLKQRVRNTVIRKRLLL
jgi:hypothetical protein